MDGCVKKEPEMKYTQNVYLVPSQDSSFLIPSPESIDKQSLLSYDDEDKTSYTRRSTSTPLDPFDYGPKRKTKPRMCTKHATHTPEQLEKCLELMEKNRIASLKSRRKKLTTIDEQRKKLSDLENAMKHYRMLAKKREVEMEKIHNQNQQLQKYVMLLQTQVAQLTQQVQQQQALQQTLQVPSLACAKNSESSSDADIEIDVENVDEKIDDAQPPSSVEKVSNMMQNTTLQEAPKSPKSLSPPDLMNLLQCVSPEFYKEISSVLKVPAPNPMEAQRHTLPIVPGKIEKITYQYAPKPTGLNLDDKDVQHTPMNYHSPAFQKIIYQIYGASPTVNLDQIPGTSKDLTK